MATQLLSDDELFKLEIVIEGFFAHKTAMVRVRFHIIRNARIENVGKSQSCMVSKLRIIWKQTVVTLEAAQAGGPAKQLLELVGISEGFASDGAFARAARRRCA